MRGGISNVEVITVLIEMITVFFRNPCTILQLRSDGTVFAGYFNGKIRVFDAVKCVLLAEISAHFRPVTCMDAYTDSNSHLVNVLNSFFLIIKKKQLQFFY